MARSSPAACRPSNSDRRVGLSSLAALGCACIATAAQVRTRGECPRTCCVSARIPTTCRCRTSGPKATRTGLQEALARDLGRSVEYTYFPQRMGFVRNTLRNKDERTQQFKCDVIIGVPKGYELTATTRPYMRSTYALVFPWRKDLADVRTADDLTEAAA